MLWLCIVTIFLVQLYIRADIQGRWKIWDFILFRNFPSILIQNFTQNSHRGAPNNNFQVNLNIAFDAIILQIQNETLPEIHRKEFKSQQVSKKVPMLSIIYSSSNQNLTWPKIKKELISICKFTYCTHRSSQDSSPRWMQSQQGLFKEKKSCHHYHIHPFLPGIQSRTQLFGQRTEDPGTTLRRALNDAALPR